MNAEYKEITCCLYGGQGLFSKAHNPYESHTVLCSNFDACPLYKNGQCLMAKRLNFKKCIYGRIIRAKGTSYRARSYYDLKSKTQEKEIYDRLNPADVRFFRIGDYLFIDTAYVDIWQNIETSTYEFRSPYSPPYGNHASEEVKNRWKRFNNYNFFRKDELTADMIKTLLKFKPRALFGGVIDAYEEKVVPQIKAEIMRYAPELAKEAGIEAVNYMGMLGKLVSLNAPIDFVKENLKCHWDGEHVTTTDIRVIDRYRTSTTWTPAIGEPVEAYVKFKPFNKLYIEIEDNGWVKADSVVKTKR